MIIPIRPPTIAPINIPLVLRRLLPTTENKTIKKPQIKLISINNLSCFILKFYSLAYASFLLQGRIHDAQLLQIGFIF
jgi:hypothetical protein